MLPDATAAVPGYDSPPNFRLQTPVIAVLATPVLCRKRVHTSGVPEHEAGPAETTALLEKVPSRPNMYPAAASAETRVTAMRITVASTGVIAFDRFKTRLIVPFSLVTLNKAIVYYESGSRVRTSLVLFSRIVRYFRLMLIVQEGGFGNAGDCADLAFPLSMHLLLTVSFF
jgi:hypothetical protein